jgi:DEAD/DEAH box helicase domain-containing protein
MAESMVRVRSGLGGLSFLLRHVAPLHLMCDTHNLGVHHDPRADFAGGSPVIAIYDNFQDGIGLSQKLYEIHDELMQQALDVVEACQCKDGCPSCVGPGGEQGQGSKPETLAILKALTGA